MPCPCIPGTWSNWIGDHGAAVMRATPKNKAELLECVEFAAKAGQRIRAVGAGHSTTPAARPDHFLIDMSRISGVLGDRWRRSDYPLADDEHLVRVLAGTRVKDLNLRYLAEQSPRMSLSNMGSFDGQTVSGALCTGTHGSSVHMGPMADAVVSLDIITVTEVRGKPHVQMRRIEPSGGMTDRDAFNADRAEHGMVLVQDDRQFDSCVVSFGAMGVVYALTLRVKSEFWLRENNRVLPWPELRRRLREAPIRVPGTDYSAPPVLVENDYFEFLVNAAEAQVENRVTAATCLARFRNVVRTRGKPDDWKKKWEWPPERRDESFYDFMERHVPSRVKEEKGKGPKSPAHWINKYFGVLEKKDPFEGDLDCSVSHRVLRRERDETKPGEPPRPPPPATSNEIAVPLDRAVEAVERVLQVMIDSDWAYLAPFGVRFVGPSRHYLAPQYGQPVCMIEVPIPLPKKDKHFDEDLAQAKRMLAAIERALCYGPGSLGGRPHHGQHNVLNRRHVEKLWGEHLDEWLEVFGRYNPFGTFENEYTRQLGLEPPARPERADRNSMTRPEEGGRRSREEAGSTAAPERRVVRRRRTLRRPEP